MIDNDNPQLQALDARLERIENKLDDHLQRVSKAEVDLEWLKGHVKVATTIFVSALSGMAVLLTKLLLGDK